MFFKKKKEKNKQCYSQTLHPPSEIMETLRNVKTSQQQQETIEAIQDIFGKDNDLCEREIEVFGNIPSEVLYLNCIVCSGYKC